MHLESARRVASAALLVFVVGVFGGSVRAGESPHRDQMEQFGGEELQPFLTAKTPPPSKAPSVNKIVYGYYPYWVSGYSSLRWDLLTHVAWFAIEMGSDGLPTATHGWPGSWTGLVNEAHAAGVRVDITFTLFSPTGIDTLVNSSQYRDNAIDTIIDAIDDGNADGASIDFEGVPSSASHGFTTFLQELRSEMDAQGMTSKQISVAGPAVDWSGAFEMDAILQIIDVYFIMGYAFFYSGSSHAGPTGILYTDDFWRTYSYGSQLRSMAYYSILDDESDRAKIVMGVPYYGREWLTADDTLGSSTTASVGAVTYEAALDDLSVLGISSTWDNHALTPWYAFDDGTDWHQVYFEDDESLAWKYRYINEQGIGGMGIWALGYDGTHTELWDEIDIAFAQTYQPNPGDKDDPLVHTEFPVNDSRDTSDFNAGGCYFNYYSCNDNLDEWGREFVYQLEICHSGEITATVGGDGGDVDNDVHILSSLNENACLDRGHTEASWEVEPGTYYVVVDTYVEDGVLQSGPYSLTIEGDGIPNPQCDAGLVCQAGQCVDLEQPDGGTDGGTDADSDSDGDSDTDVPTACYPVSSTDESCACTLFGGEKRTGVLSLLSILIE